MVQMRISYHTLLELVDQLTDAQREALLAHLKSTTGQMSADERIAMFRAGMMNNPVNEEPSVRREDWYGDDGR
jgi:hypothetical protein